jgi:hypothetical protein
MFGRLEPKAHTQLVYRCYELAHIQKKSGTIKLHALTHEAKFVGALSFGAHDKFSGIYAHGGWIHGSTHYDGRWGGTN